MKPQALRRWAEFIETQRRAWKAPGVAAAVFTNNEILFLGGIGRRRRDRPDRVTPATPFCIGSTSKAFAAAALAQLVDEGRLDWDAPVRDYWPEFALMDSDATRLITARDLLTHRSGLPRHDAVWFGNGSARAEVAARLRHLQPNKTFRQAYQYQNLMYLAAGYLAERITGESWENRVREKIFAPLGMASSGFSFDGALDSPERARGHNTVKGKVRLLRWKPIGAANPAGGITSTAEDMIAWVRLHMSSGAANHGGAKRSKQKPIINPKSLKALHTPIMAVPDSDTYAELLHSTYALGWNVRMYRGHRMLAHGGMVNGFSTHVAFLPQAEIGAIVMANISMSPLPQLLVYNAFDRVLELKLVDWSVRFRKEKSAEKRTTEKKKRERQKLRVRRTSPTLPLEAFCGDYEHPGYGKLIVRRKGAALWSLHNNVESKWAHYHYDQFVITEVEYDTEYVAACTLDSRGRIGSVAINYEENADPILFKKID